MLPSPDPRQFSSEKLFLGKLLPKPNSCIANLNLLASMAAKINTGVPNFLDAALARTPANFGPKSCFLVSYCPSPTCIPNLKLLASTVAEINRGSSHFLDTPLARTPANFGRKRCFSASYSPSQSCVPNLKLLASTVAEINRKSHFWMLP